MTPEIEQQIDRLKLQIELARANAADLGRQFNEERQAHSETKAKLAVLEQYAANRRRDAEREGR